GSVEFDRPLPLVCVHDRTTRSHPHDHSVEMLTQGAPNHVVIDSASEHGEATPLIERYVESAVSEFGGCVLAELTSSATRHEIRPTPSVTLRRYGPGSESDSLSRAFEAFETELTRRKIRGLRPIVMRAAAASARPLLEPFERP